MLIPPSATAQARRIPLLLLTVVAVMLCCFCLQHQALAQENAPIPFRDPDDPWLIRDDARMFNGEQLDRFQFDLRRLQRLGVDVMVYTRQSDASTRESERFAEELRDTWNVDSEPGADDGLLILLNVSEEFPRRSAFIVSAGRNFYPVGQLDEADFTNILEQEIQPNFGQERYDVALAYAVRRLLYAADYTPPNPPALTGIQSFAHEVGRIGGPVMLQASLLGLVLVPVLMEHRLTTRPSRKSVQMYALIFATASGLIALFSVVGRSDLGILMAVLVSALVLAVVAYSQRFRPEPAVNRQHVQVPSARDNRLRRRSRMHLHHRNDRYARYT